MGFRLGGPAAAAGPPFISGAETSEQPNKFYRCEDGAVARDRRKIDQEGPVARKVRL
jgi:hypothetical protein